MVLPNDHSPTGINIKLGNKTSPTFSPETTASVRKNPPSESSPVRKSGNQIPEFVSRPSSGGPVSAPFEGGGDQQTRARFVVGRRTGHSQFCSTWTLVIMEGLILTMGRMAKPLEMGRGSSHTNNQTSSVSPPKGRAGGIVRWTQNFGLEKERRGRRERRETGIYFHFFDAKTERWH